jgi:hypothetical protein
MEKDKNITKFSIGRFTNGAYTIYGFIYSGLLHGIVIRTTHPDIYRLFSFLKLYEFNFSVDNIPEFKKIRLVKSILRSITGYYGVSEIIDFMTEVTDLPTCAFKCSNFISSERRTVLIEKYNLKSIFSNYTNLDEQLELTLIKTISKKYGGKGIVKNIYVSNKKNEHIGDRHENICTITVPCFHNKTIFIELKALRELTPLYQAYIDSMYRINVLEKGLDYNVNKIN